MELLQESLSTNALDFGGYWSQRIGCASVHRKKTYWHFMHRLRSRVGIEEGVVLSPDPIDAVGRNGGLIRGSLHC